MNKSFGKYFKQSFLTALWMMLLSFPFVVIKVKPRDSLVIWRWVNLAYMGAGSFVLSWIWRFFLDRKEKGGRDTAEPSGNEGNEKETSAFRGRLAFLRDLKEKRPKLRLSFFGLLAVLVLAFPLMVNFYQVGIITSALIFVILGLGLNIVIGYGGLLHLGYAAFYAVGAYNYGIMYLNWGLQFWLALPLGAVSGLLFGLLIGIPVLRLRGDYLAIVTLAFGEIVRLLLENMASLTKGPEGIAQIPRPAFFTSLSLQGATNYLYYITVLLVFMTIVVIRRIEDSRLGRSLEAMKEDEIAAQAMGIDLTRAKLATFALGAFWAGMAGVVLAAKTTYINPRSFTLMESVMILVAVVLGGTGSIPGVFLGALLVTLIPEYFRVLADYRMMMFGVALVVMSIFRPQGIIPRVRKKYSVDGENL